MWITLFILLAVILIGLIWNTEGFRATKCFSCEAQDARMGIYRGYPTKCFSCERQDLRMGIIRGHPEKCFSCSPPRYF